MTIGTTFRNDAIGNDTLTTYPYGFKIFAATHLVVTVRLISTGVETELTYPTHYTVTGVGTTNGGNVVLTDVDGAWQNAVDGTLKTGYAIAIRRVVPVRQNTDVRNQGGFFANVHEDAFDYLTMILQQHEDMFDRSLTLPDSFDPTTFDMQLPVPSAGMAIGWNVTGDGLTNLVSIGSVGVSAYMETVLDDANAAAARATLGAASSADGAILSANIAANAITAIKLATSALGASPHFINGTLVHSRAANAETIAIKTIAGTDPSATDPVYVIFRNVTATTGDYTILTLTAATSFTISSGSTLGFPNSTAQRLWIVGFNDGGTFRLGVINCLDTSTLGSDREIDVIYRLKGWGIASSTAEGGAGGADSKQVFYTGTAVTSKAYTVLGYSTWESGLATAGTWGTAPTRTQLFGPGVPLPGDTIQILYTSSSAVATGTTVIPRDDTIPQNTEGDQYMSRSILPSSAANAIRTRALAQLTNGTGTYVTGALFKDATADALKVTASQGAAAGRAVHHAIETLILAGSTSAITMKYRAGSDVAGTTTFNGEAAARTFGGRSGSFIECEEIMA